MKRNTHEWSGNRADVSGAPTVLVWEILSYSQYSHFMAVAPVIYVLSRKKIWKNCSCQFLSTIVYLNKMVNYEQKKPCAFVSQACRPKSRDVIPHSNCWYVDSQRVYGRDDGLVADLRSIIWIYSSLVNFYENLLIIYGKRHRGGITL